MQLKWSPSLSWGLLAVCLLTEMGLYFPLSVEQPPHPAAQLMFFAGDGIEVLGVAPVASADVAPASLDPADTCAGVQTGEKLFVLEALPISPSRKGAEVAREFTSRLVSSGS